MAARKICVRNIKDDTAERWTGLFLNDLETQQKSLIFVKRMMALAVSTITYLRGIFPEDAYRSRYLEDLCIKVLREDCSAPRANKIVKWMMGSFDALEKQYLRSVFIGVYTNPDEPNCVVESYQFRFKYTENGPQMNILRNHNVEMQVTLEDTKRASLLLIRKLFLLTQNLDALPNNVFVTMKLYYYDDITPADYEPPGFKAGECDSLWFEGMPVHFKVGEVQTTFHTLRVRVSVEQGRMEKLQAGTHLREAEQVPQGNTDKEITEDPHKKEEEEDFPSEDESEQFKKPKRPLAKRNKTAKKTQRKKRN